MGYWNQIANGATYDFTGKLTGDYSIATHARVLSRMPRYNAHTVNLWPIAAHACVVMEVIASMQAFGTDWMLLLEALHHDDHEVITGDIVQPMKQELKAAALGHDHVGAIAHRAQRALDAHFKIAHLMRRDDFTGRVIKAADIAVCDAERRMMLGPYVKWDMEAYVDDAMVLAAKRILETDYKIAEMFGEPAAERYLMRHNQLLQKLA